MLIANNVHLVRARKPLLQQVSLTLQPGQVVAVLGPNGAGKSTLLRTLAGEVRPTLGIVSLLGKPLSSWSAGLLARQRAVLPQASLLSFPMAAREVVLYGRYPHCQAGFSRADRDIAEQMLDRMGVAHLAELDFTHLSGGEKSRVQLARVFAQIHIARSTDAHADAALPPRFLLFDEPTAALDLPHQHHLLQQARALAEEDNVGVMVILHDINLAAAYADRMVLMRAGMKLAEGNVGEIMQPEMIARCFQFESMIMPHPVSGQPVMLPLGPAQVATGARITKAFLS